MTILAFPALSRTAPTSMTFSLVHNTMSFSSPLNRTVQTAELPGAKWAATLIYNNLTESDIRILRAWLSQLRGMSGRFYLTDFSHRTPAGSASGTPLVKGASQTGRTLITDGWTANQNGLLLPGDYIGVNGELKIITATANSDSSGNATLSFEPPLRSAPADNAPVIVTSPVCTMMLKDDEQDRLEIREGHIANVQIDCVEAFA